MTEMLWEDASLADRMEVARIYNKFYNTSNQALSFEQLDACWTGSRWITIKYTFGIEP